jgi:hypothetical protein
MHFYRKFASLDVVTGDAKPSETDAWLQKPANTDRE